MVVGSVLMVTDQWDPCDYDKDIGSGYMAPNHVCHVSFVHNLYKSTCFKMMRDVFITVSLIRVTLFTMNVFLKLSSETQHHSNNKEKEKHIGWAVEPSCFCFPFFAGPGQATNALAPTWHSICHGSS